MRLRTALGTVFPKLYKVDRISFSLRTKSQSVAAKRALKHAMELDDYLQLFTIRSGVFEKYFTGSSFSESLLSGFENSVENRLYFSDALRLYLEV